MEESKDIDALSHDELQRSSLVYERKKLIREKLRSKH